ncbi:uncharacterized protein LOC123531376 isoform X2 [Mercenaria mercenaria]|uniref:uncharacterized protein LOC123531376 isoform X2 n=1 Tax=Mercenaria mercenaria TaxID=6596 RepID=UPI00234E8804|nr:uncharacterized protein LOC123531376 isoform X2 [Mercenaria mercenaria]
MWNCKVLIPPPYCEMKTLLKPAEKGCLLEARKFLKKSDGPINDHMKLMTAELYMTKRIIYKLSNQFRSDKGLKTLKQVHTCLKRLEIVNIEKQLADSLQLIDKVCSGDETEFFLPSRQVIEYQLVILQGAGALLRQTVQYCQKSFIHVRQHLELGHMIPQNIALLALISRLWYVCNSLGLYVCKWYGKLYSCLNIFRYTAVPWNEELPEDLSEWLTELFGDEPLPEQDLMKNVKVEKESGSLPQSVEFLEAAYQEDLGEPIQRKHLVQEPYLLPDIESSGTEHILSSSSKRKFEIDTVENGVKQTPVGKKQKLSVGNKNTGFKPETEKQESTMKYDIDEPSTDMASKKREKEEQLSANLTDTDTVDDKLTVKLPEVNISSIQSMIAHLETVLLTYEDVDNFVKQIKSGTFEVCGTCLNFSKVGKKKIMKKIYILYRLKNLMKDKDSSSKTEKIFLKKVRGSLSELLVKHNQTTLGEAKKERTVLKSSQALDVKNRDMSFLPQGSEMNVLEDEPLDVKEINDVKEHVEHQNTVKKKRKKKKNKMKTELNSNALTETECVMKTKDKIQTAVKTTSSKKRKKKSKRK